MSNKDSDNSTHLELEGTVIDSTKGIFRVSVPVRKIENDEDPKDYTVIARLAGKLRKFKIGVVPGDRVIVKVSPYDLSNGIISRRL